MQRLIADGIISRNEYFRPETLKWYGESKRYRLLDESERNVVAHAPVKKRRRKKICIESADLAALPDPSIPENTSAINYQDSIDALSEREASELRTIRSLNVPVTSLEKIAARISETKEQFTHHMASIMNLVDFQYAKTTDSNGRVNTNLTNLKRELRDELLKHNEFITADIKSSQPSILANVLIQEGYRTSDVYAFKKAALSGEIYDFLVSELGIERDDAKKQVLTQMYQEEHDYWNKSKVRLLLEEQYPTVMDFIVKSKEETSNRDLALSLQRIESDFISKVCDELTSYRIEFVTVFDSVSVHHSNEQKLLDVMKMVMFEMDLDLRVKITDYSMVTKENEENKEKLEQEIVVGRPEEQGKMGIEDVMEDIRGMLRKVSYMPSILPANEFTCDGYAPHNPSISPSEQHSEPLLR